MPTRPQTEFRLDPIIHEASDEERSEPAYAGERYWRFANGEISRNAPFFRVPSNTRCFIVVTGTPLEPVVMTFETTLPVAGTSWAVPVTGAVTIMCPQTHVYLLVTRWTRMKRIGSPDRSFADEIVQHLRAEASTSTEAMLVDANDAPGGGALGSRVATKIQALWGLMVDVRFKLAGAERIVATDLTIETTTRLVDYDKEISVKAVIDLLANPTSTLRALATLGAEQDIRAALTQEVRSFYPDNVHIDSLFDPSLRDVWKPQLAKRLEQRAFVFGRQARLAQLEEVPPSLPGDAEEVVRITMPDLVLDGQEKVELALLSTFRLTNRSMLLRAMAPRPTVVFNTELHQLVRGALLRVSSAWRSKDLQIAERARRERELSAALETLVPSYGYALTRCTLTTSRDPDLAGLEPALTVTCAAPVSTADPSVTVHVGVLAELKYRLGETQRAPRGEMRTEVEQAIIDEIGKRLAAFGPSAIYRRWNAPVDGKAPIRDQLTAGIINRLKKYADDPTIVVTLSRHLEHLRQYDSLLRSRIQCEGVRLNPENVPGEVRVDLNARVVAIPERAWADILAPGSADAPWDPVAEATEQLPRMLQTAFATVLNSTRNNHLSKRTVIDLLGQRIAATVLEEFKIQIAPEVRLYSPPEVVAFYQEQARRRQQDVQRYFTLRDQISDAILAKKQEQIRLISEGLGSHPELQAVDEALMRLEEHQRDSAAQTEVLQREFADASQYVSLLTAAPEPEAQATKETIIDATVVSPQPEQQAASATPEPA